MCRGRHYTSTIDNKPDITFNKKTEKGIKLFRGVCGLCKRSKAKMVIDNTIAADGLQDFFTGVSKAAKNLVETQTIIHLERCKLLLIYQVKLEPEIQNRKHQQLLL